ncbi:hypothetical protein L218DRAFT_500741 [Marasmius fiardii PR-910]|nr:hypothetical protein L218DRAFT_500741 [Marasmius fiardii PR-910]
MTVIRRILTSLAILSFRLGSHQHCKNREPTSGASSVERGEPQQELEMCVTGNIRCKTQTGHRDRGEEEKGGYLVSSASLNRSAAPVPELGRHDMNESWVVVLIGRIGSTIFNVTLSESWSSLPSRCLSRG